MIKLMLPQYLFNKANAANIMLLVSMLLVISPHLFRIPIWLSFICLALIIWRLFYESGKGSLPNQFVKLLLILIAISAIILSYQTIVGRNAGSAFLLLMFCLKLTEFKTSRDAFVIVFLGYFIVITSFLFSQSIPIAIYMFMVLIALTSTLVAFQHPSPLFSQRQHIMLAMRMLVFSIPLAAILFLLFPRATAPLWGLPEDAFSAKTGISDYMSPGRIERLSNSDEVAFRVKFNNRLPSDNQLYWRGPVLWSFDGFTWTSPKKERFVVRKLPYRGIGDAIEYSVTLEPHTRHWLFALDLPARILPESRLSAEMLLISLKPVQQIKKYGMQSYTDYRFFYLPGHTSSTRYKSIPDNIAPRTKKLVAQWKNESSSDIDIVKKALDYFTNKPFYYSRNPPLLFDDPVDEFMFKTQKGYCEHFSSAFTFMMRAADLPARVVTGYYGGELNPLGDYMIVRQSDAHAWSEVFIKNRGWVRIDPTSVIPPSRIENSADVVRIQPKSDKAVNILKETSWLYRSYKNINNLVDSINNSWTQWIIGYNNKKQTALFRAFGMPDITWKGLSTVMFSLLTILLLLISYYLLSSNTKLDPVNKVYARFCKKMKKRGYIKQENETATCFAKRIIKNEPELKSVIMGITTKYNSLHYGKYQTKMMLHALEDNIKSLKI